MRSAKSAAILCSSVIAFAAVVGSEAHAANFTVHIKNVPVRTTNH